MNPDFTNPAALAYRDQFIAGAESEQLGGIPDDLLSRLITAAIGQSWGAEEAGKVFARLYWKLVMRPMWTDDRLRYGIVNHSAYLIGAYKQELEDLKRSAANKALR